MSGRRRLRVVSLDGHLPVAFHVELGDLAGVTEAVDAHPDDAGVGPLVDGAVELVPRRAAVDDRVQRLVGLDLVR